MGYNVLSGNVLLPGQLLADGQISSSAFVGDGKELQHVLKITSGPDQYNLTTIGTDAYKLTGQSNLTFNGTTLTGSYTGSLAEFTTLSASAANLTVASGTMAGPGSYLALDTSNNVVLATGDGATSTPAGANTQIQFNDGGSWHYGRNMGG